MQNVPQCRCCFSSSLCHFGDESLLHLGFGGHLGDLFGTCVLLFGALVAKWGPGPKNLEKETPKTKRNSSIVIRIRCLFGSLFLGIFGVSLDCLFVILVAKVS